MTLAVLQFAVADILTNSTTHSYQFGKLVTRQLWEWLVFLFGSPGIVEIVPSFLIFAWSAGYITRLTPHREIDSLARLDIENHSVWALLLEHQMSNIARSTPRSSISFSPFEGPSASVCSPPADPVCRIEVMTRAKNCHEGKRRGLLSLAYWPTENMPPLQKYRQDINELQRSSMTSCLRLPP